ncbi:MAG: N-acetylneuraminate synthase [Anaerolineae bacterium]|nr:N-acetylneuraminate synthase [Anaerolineae bacterium]
MVTVIKAANRQIGPEYPCFIIAEAGVNHNGNPEMARQLIDAAAEAGADAIKFQTFHAEKLISRQARKADYQVATTGDDQSQLEMVKRLELAEVVQRDLQCYAQKRNLLFISTPFDEESADFLNTLDVPLFKIGSGELTNWPFLQHLACKGKPLILSTGMSYLSEVDEAVRVIYAAGNTQLALLHCVSNYPANPADVNLRAMETLRAAFDVPVGYSDHTLGIEVALAAVARGACILEKHFTLDRSLPGPDHRASLNPSELHALVRGIRTVESALGSGRKQPAPSEADTTSVARRSIVAARDIAAGTRLTRDLLVIKRPGDGLPASMLGYLVGRITRHPIPADSLITLAMLE